MMSASVCNSDVDAAIAKYVPGRKCFCFVLALSIKLVLCWMWKIVNCFAFNLIACWVLQVIVPVSIININGGDFFLFNMLQQSGRVLLTLVYDLTNQQSCFL